MNGSRSLGILLLGLLMAVPAAARVILVPTDEPTLERALRIAANRDTVQVGSGVFAGGITLPAGVTIRGVQGRTILEAPEEGPIVHVPQGGRGTELIGLVLSGGTVAVRLDRSSLSLEACELEGNTEAAVDAGPRTELSVDNCRFRLNDVGVRSGGLLYLVGCWIQANRVGVEFTGEDARVFRNRVTTNHVGIAVGDTSRVLLGGTRVFGNDLFANDSLTVAYSGADSLDAGWNFWGSLDCDAVAAQVSGPLRLFPLASLDRNETVASCP